MYLTNFIIIVSKSSSVKLAVVLIDLIIFHLHLTPIYYIILCYVINIMLYFLLRYIYIYIYIYIYKKWLRFFKNGCNWGGWGIFTYLQLSLHSWQRVLAPLFYEDYPLFFKFCPNPPLLPLPSHLQTYPHCSFCCPVSLAEFVITPHLMCYFT